MIYLSSYNTVSLQITILYNTSFAGRSANMAVNFSQLHSSIGYLNCLKLAI
jgi:hypothetical protein